MAVTSFGNDTAPALLATAIITDLLILTRKTGRTRLPRTGWRQTLKPQTLNLPARADAQSPEDWEDAFASHDPHGLAAGALYIREVVVTSPGCVLPNPKP